MSSGCKKYSQISTFTIMIANLILRLPTTNILNGWAQGIITTHRPCAGAWFRINFSKYKCIQGILIFRVCNTLNYLKESGEKKDYSRCSDIHVHFLVFTFRHSLSLFL